MVILIGYAASTTGPVNVLNNVAFDLFKAERYVQIEAMPQITSENIRHLDFSDQVLYYAISKTVDGRTNVLGLIMR